MEISQDHQLVLACSWLNLKECSLMAGFLVKSCDLLTSESGDNFCLHLDAINSCGNILMTVLTKCRHKGAMEVRFKDSYFLIKY